MILKHIVLIISKSARQIAVNLRTQHPATLPLANKSPLQVLEISRHQMVCVRISHLLATETHDNKELADANEDDDENDENADQLGASPPPFASHNRGRRSSVSAESMVPSTSDNFEKVVVPKSEEQRARIRIAISGNFLFKDLDEDQLNDVVDAMSEKQVATGDEIIKQGGVGDFFYIVEQGTFDIFVTLAGQAKPKKVSQVEAGGNFGELALMYNAPRAATIISTNEGILWALDRVTFRRILMERTSRKRRMYELFLEEVPLFSPLEVYERNKIADALESVVYEDGAVVIRQGDVGDNFYIIESGVASVTQLDESGAEVIMSELNKGDYFGGGTFS